MQLLGGSPRGIQSRQDLRTLPEPDADRALRDVAGIIAELRAAGLESQLDKARDLRRAVLAAAEAFTACEEAGE